jgi:replicative DNA helicase
MDALRVPPDQRRELWQRIRTGASTDAASVQDLVRRSPASRPTVAEEKLLQLLLANEELRKIVLPRLEATGYEDLAAAPVFRALIKLDQDGSEINFDSVSEETAGDSLAAGLLPRLIMDEVAESFDESMAAADSCLDALRLMKVDRRIDELSSEMAEAERAGEDERRDRLALELLQLSKQRGDFLFPAQSSKTVH